MVNAGAFIEKPWQLFHSIGRSAGRALLESQPCLPGRQAYTYIDRLVDDDGLREREVSMNE